MGLTLTFFNLSIPPADLPIYLGLAGIALIPMMFGEKRFRVFGGVAILVSLIIANIKHFAGVRENERLQRFRQMIEAGEGRTNVSPSQSP